jgi:hypothetical protein
MKMTETKELVAKSLGESQHIGVYAWLDARIAKKPSVTLAMMYLVMIFIGSWASLLGFHLFMLICLPVASY